MRPKAYLILPEQKALIEKLTILGLEVEQVKEETSYEVESYLVTEYRIDLERYEGVHRQYVSTETNVITKPFPEGTYILSLNQPKGNLGIEVLEPEAPNSFVRFEVLETALGEELPVYRLMR